MAETTFEPDRVANLLGAAAVAVGDVVRAATERAAARGATAPAALVTLAYYPGRPVEDLARALRLTHSGAVRLVDRLVADGLAERRRGPDARALALVLTDRGRAACAEVLDARERALLDALAPLDAVQLEALGGALERVLAGLVEEPGSVRRICRLCDEDACERAGAQCPVAAAAR